MVIVFVMGGLGNQLFHYATGRRLSYKLNTEFKLDVRYYHDKKNYALNLFNVHENLATLEEIEYVQSHGIIKKTPYAYCNLFLLEPKDCPDNVYLKGCWEDERNFADIVDIIREEFTLKNPLSPNAEAWKQKILAADCAVSIHIRRGDFLRYGMSIFAFPPLDYFYECINQLKQQYKNLTLFVFSNDINWFKEHFISDLSIEFVSGGMKDVEELYLMSLCKHNIGSNSTFSWWGAWLNQNPDKKVFYPLPSNIFGTKQTWRNFSAERNENSPLDSDKWIRVPFDLDKRLNLFFDQADVKSETVNVKIRPIFSLLLVVNDDSATLAETLNSLFKQDYKYYEVIIVDNSLNDVTTKLCRDTIVGKENVIFRKLYSKVTNVEAWNMALNMAQGQYVSFIKGNDRLWNSALTQIYLAHGNQDRNIICCFAMLVEDEKGKIGFGDKKLSLIRDAQFNWSEKRNAIMSTNGQDAVKFLANQQINSFLGTKFYNREFLKEHNLKFNEQLDDSEAELAFQTEAFAKSNYLMYVANAVYIAPRK